MTVKEFKNWLDRHSGGDDQDIDIYIEFTSYGDEKPHISFSETWDQWFFDSGRMWQESAEGTYQSK